MDKCQKKMKALAHQLLLLILTSLNLSQHYLNKSQSQSQPQGALQLNSYPTCPDPTRAIGLAPHTDSLLLTILHQSQTKGLQLFRVGSWVPVEPVNGALVVNVGDLLHILSNAKLPTAYHRVVVNKSETRMSFAYFYGSPVDFPVGPLSEIEIPVYRSLSLKEYIGLKAKYLDKALEFIRI
ncbi:hypothetical protein LguiB_012091 [Lonicera macranthoides]